MIDDDYCMSYTVTMVDVRSCTRPPRILNQQYSSDHPHILIPPRSPDQACTSEHADIFKQFKPQFSTSTSIRELCYAIIKCIG